MLLGASTLRNKIFCAATAPNYHGACDGRRAKEAALSATTVPHLFDHPHF
jgi:hypothetical protein